MKKQLIILSLLTLSSIVSCKKDKNSTNTSKDYYDILNSGTGWNYFMNLRMPAPMNNQTDFVPFALKSYNDQLELYTYTRTATQQSDLFIDKIYTTSLTTPGKPVATDLNYSHEDGYGIIIQNEFKDYLFTRTYNNGGIHRVAVTNKNNNQLFEKDVYENGYQYIYTEDNRLFLMGTKTKNYEFKTTNAEGINIINTIVDSVMAMQSFYYLQRTELQELFVSENGYLTAAVMQNEVDHYENNVKMITVGFTKTTKCDSSALIALKKGTDNKYVVAVYSGKDAKLSQYIYDPEFYTFQIVYQNRDVPAHLNWIDVTTTGKVYMRTATDLFQTVESTYKEIPLDIFKPKIEVNAEITLCDIVVRRDRLFGLVAVKTFSPYPAQVSVIEYTSK